LNSISLVLFQLQLFTFASHDDAVGLLYLTQNL